MKPYQAYPTPLAYHVNRAREDVDRSVRVGVPLEVALNVERRRRPPVDSPADFARDARWPMLKLLPEPGKA